MSLGKTRWGDLFLTWLKIKTSRVLEIVLILSSENHVVSINDTKRIEIIEVKRYKTDFRNWDRVWRDKCLGRMGQIYGASPQEEWLLCICGWTSTGTGGSIHPWRGYWSWKNALHVDCLPGQKCVGKWDLQESVITLSWTAKVGPYGPSFSIGNVNYYSCLSRQGGRVQ